jgi:hypothetical protein
MPDTFVKIASVTVGSGGAASIDFTSIPSTYTDLCIKHSLRIGGTSVQDVVDISFNGSTASFSGRILFGTGAAAASTSSYTRGAGTMAEWNFTANTFGNSEIYIPNYAGSNNKSLSADGVSENNGTTALAILFATLWSNTSAITSISLTPYGGGSFVQYSTATLYGIKNS